jgi:hypothetical protein
MPQGSESEPDGTETSRPQPFDPCKSSSSLNSFLGLVGVFGLFVISYPVKLRTYVVD